MPCLHQFALLISVIFGSVYDSQLGLSQNDLELQKFAEDDNVMKNNVEQEQPAADSVMITAAVVHQQKIPHACCNDATPQCMACKAGMSVKLFCTDNPVIGCPGMKEPERQPDDKKKVTPPKSAISAEPAGSSTCTIEAAENNQACPMAKCASPEAIRKRCKGKDWEAVKEISDSINCCLKLCNFRCKTDDKPSHGSQHNIFNTNAIPDSPENQTPPKEVKKISKTVYMNAPIKNENKGERTKEKEPSVKLQLFDSTVTTDGFTFSYEIFNANDKGGFYWTVQRKESGSLLAASVEKDGETAPCSGYGVQEKALKTINVDVSCPFVPGKTYLLWFALDMDQQGSGVFLSPSEPVSLTIPSVNRRPSGSDPSTTMSAYGYSLTLNNGKVEDTTLEKLAKEMDTNQQSAEKSAKESADSAEIHHIFHVVNVQNAEQQEEKAKKSVQNKKKKIEEIKNPETYDLAAENVRKAITQSKENQEEENTNEDESTGKYRIGSLTRKGLTVTCKTCPQEKKSLERNGKLYYLMIHHQEERPDGTFSAMHVLHTVDQKGEKSDDQEKEVSGSINLSDASEFSIGHELQGKSYKLYLASDLDGKGKGLQLVDAIDVRMPEDELSSYANALNYWRQIFFAFFVVLAVGSLTLAFQTFFLSKRAQYSPLLIDFETYEEEF